MNRLKTQGQKQAWRLAYQKVVRQVNIHLWGMTADNTKGSDLELNTMTDGIGRVHNQTIGIKLSR